MKTQWALRLLVDLRKINNLITEDYINNNYPVSTLSDAVQRMAGKKLVYKLDSSQAFTTASKWQITNPSKCSPSILQAEHLHIVGLPRVSADIFLHFQAS